MSKPLIFLDFDGVLNTYKTWGKFPREDAIEPELVERVKRLCEETDAEIVISSAWRTIYPLNELKRLLEKRGGLQPELVIGITPDWHGPFSQRGQEIGEWRGVNGREADPYVILDDLWPGAFIGQESHHVQTMLTSGFTEERLEYAKGLLAKQASTE